MAQEKKFYFRLAVTKEMPGGGASTVDIPSWNPITGELHMSLDDMEATYQEANRILDARHREMVQRIVDVSGMRSYFSPAEWQKVVCLLDVIEGRQSALQVVQRWKAIEEENRELEATRQAALAAQQEQEVTELHHEATGPFVRMGPNYYVGEKA